MAYAVIPTRDRADSLGPLLRVLVADGVTPIVVDTGDNEWMEDLGVIRALVLRDPPNISQWWNLGLDIAAGLGGDGEYVVAVLNDDLVMAPGTIALLTDALLETGATIAFPDMYGLLGPGQRDVLRRAAPHNLFHRMTGYCFLLRGSADLRADERFVWWAGDDDLEWRAALMGGVVRVGGCDVQHLHANESTIADPALMEQTGRDMAAFVEKWGQRPW